MIRRRLLGQLGVGLGVAIVHHLLQFASWAAWDRALRPGEVRTMPTSWPILSFPAFPLYHWLSGGDRDMFQTFDAVMIANSLTWGAGAVIIFTLFARRRAAPAG